MRSDAAEDWSGPAGSTSSAALAPRTAYPTAHQVVERERVSRVELERAFEYRVRLIPTPLSERHTLKPVAYEGRHRIGYGGR